MADETTSSLKSISGGGSIGAKSLKEEEEEEFTRVNQVTSRCLLKGWTVLFYSFSFYKYYFEKYK